ncbi:transglycosylase SLT domain-containing protein [Vibrio sp. WJH972]
MSRIDYQCKGITKTLILVTLMGSWQTASAALANSQLEQQRKLYDQAQQWFDARTPQRYQKVKSKLASYPLTPYLEYRSFLIGLEQRSPQEVQRFIETYQELPFSNVISKTYLQLLGQSKQWNKLLQFSRTEPKGEVSQCFYNTAQWHKGDRQQALDGGLKLWLSGDSVASECDPLFSQLFNQKKITNEHILQRIELAFKENNPRLMGYLAKKLTSSTSKKRAQQISKLYEQPQLVKGYIKVVNTGKKYDWEMIDLGLARLTHVSTKAVQAMLSDMNSTKLKEDEQGVIQALSEKIALRLMETQDTKLASWNDEIFKQSPNIKVVSQRIRYAIELTDWTTTHQMISALSDDIQQEPEWQYWLGRSEIALGKTISGKERLRKLLGLRNFYSVSAANILDKPVEYPTDQIEYQPELLAEFDSSLIRIEELLARDKGSAARSEWYWLLKRSSIEQKAMLAQYALLKEWSHYGVVASIQAKLWSNVTLRFPVAHLDNFTEAAQKQKLDPITLLSLARQESALDNIARSGVGARGLMQLMPKTARYTAKKYQVKLQSSEELYEADKNIELGSIYFAELMKKYNQNRILALAAYNAGPHRVDRWLSERAGRLDAYQFIESIPFNETRRYVQNILMFETYYRDQLGIERPFLKENEINSKY